MTQQNRKLSKEILDHHLKLCYEQHNVQLSEKYIGYLMNAMEDYSIMRRTFFDKLLVPIACILSIFGIGLIGVAIYTMLTKGC